MQKPEAMRVVAAIFSAEWAIEERWLETILGIAERRISDFEAVLQSRGEQLVNTDGVTMHQGIAVLPVRGPIARYGNMFTNVSGLTSIDSLATDFNQAVSNPAVKGIVLEMDSPGGMVAGISEFSAQVRAATQIKPVIAYVSDKAASAAYWIASAASEIVIANTAQLGSIGVISQLSRDSADGSTKFISSQSPYKHVRPESEAGQRLYQQQVDAIAQVFIDSVAAYRGVTADKVLSDFGQGHVLVGAAAVAAGMADRLGSLESIIAGLAGDTRKRAFAMNITRELIAAEHPAIADAFRAEGAAGVVLTVDSIKASHPAVFAAILAEGATTERNRIKAVQDQSLPGYEKQIDAMMFDGTTTGEQAAVAVLKLERDARGNQAAAIVADGGQLAVVPAAPAPAAAAALDSLPLDERSKAEWDSSASIRSQFASLKIYQAYQRAVADGQVKDRVPKR